jgi:Phage integrase family
MAAIPTHTWSGLRDRALIEVLFSTGMRISEALSLDRSAIDWDRGEAVVIGKGKKQRKVYFREQTINRLQRYLEKRLDDFPAVFIRNGQTIQRLQGHGSWKRLSRYARLAGLAKRVYPHMLRHTMATTLLANGCPIGHIRVLLGHAHLATTCRYYLGMMSDAEARDAHKKYLHTENEDDEGGHDDEADDHAEGRHGLEEPLHRIHGAHGAPIMRKLMTGAVSAIIAFMLISPGTETPARALTHHAVHANAVADAEVRDVFDDQSTHMGWPRRPVMGPARMMRVASPATQWTVLPMPYFHSGAMNVPWVPDPRFLVGIM